MPKTDQSEKRYLSLRIKIWFAFILIFTPVFIASYIWFYLYTSEKVLNSISEDLVQTVSGAIENMDVEGFVTLYEEESTNNPLCPPALGVGVEDSGYYPENLLYWEHVTWLSDVEKVEPEANVYTYIKGDEPGEVIGIGSSGALRDPVVGFKFCQSYTSTTSRIYDGLSQRVDVWEPYEDTYGSWITTYMPIHDANDKIVGAIGIDILASYVQDVQAGIVRNGLIAFVISYILIFGLVYLMSGIVTRPLIRLATVSKEIGDGNYDQDLDALDNLGRWDDEIDTLSDTMKIMISKVAQREQTLRKRVHQLEIMVDNTKREEEVKQIVESDFFQDLQAKAKNMRQQFKGGKDK